MRSAKGKMSFIAVDGDRSCLFELLEDRRLRSLFKHYQQFTRAARCRVKYLVMDMNAAYDQLVKTVFLVLKSSMIAFILPNTLMIR